MSRIRSQDNKATELRLTGIFRAIGISGWRRHTPIFGKPDFIFLKLRVAVFVDGCFWHSCPKHSTKPMCNRAFWEKKLTANKERDRLVNRTLRRKSWKVVRIWEHDLDRNHVHRTLRKLRSIGLPSQ